MLNCEFRILENIDNTINLLYFNTMETDGPSIPPELPHFETPEGYLDGTVFDIALRLLKGYESDYDWHQRNSPDTDDGLIDNSREVISRLRERLESNDEELAHALAMQAAQLVHELREGHRVTVPGQAHLLSERA